MTPSAGRPRLLTPKEVAAYLQISVKTLKRLPIPFTKIGRQKRYHPELVEKYELAHSNLPIAWKAATSRERAP